MRTTGIVHVQINGVTHVGVVWTPYDDHFDEHVPSQKTPDHPIIGSIYLDTHNTNCDI